MMSLSRGYGEDRRTSCQSRPPSWLERRGGLVAVGVACDDRVSPKRVDEKRNFQNGTWIIDHSLENLFWIASTCNSVHLCFAEKDCNFAA